MKKTLLLISMTILSLMVKSQEIEDCDIWKYKIAYNYVLNDQMLSRDSTMYNEVLFSIEKTIVSDSIVDIDKTFFQKYRKKSKIESDTEWYAKHLKKEIEEPIYSSRLPSIFGKKEVEEPIFILYFSKVEGYILSCEIMALHRYKLGDWAGLTELSYSKNASFNNSYKYLFIFNENDLIEDVERVEVHYD